jgi:molybdopterin/thiamine biosynthesis adenylyltransferase/nitroreductase
MNRDINQRLSEQFTPIFFRLGNTEQKVSYHRLLSEKKTLIIHDEIDGQLRELIKSLHPSRKILLEEYPALIQAHLNGTDINEYGVWVYYPWLNSVVHILDEEEFVEVRTNRNRYKITREEQASLRERKIGVIGLSVGQSIALTLAQERVCGELRLADFDTAELSNLNRIRTGVQNLGLRKTVIAAREISELDPYLKVSIFNDGLTKTNIDEYFTGGSGKLDLVVEVCDGLDVKILARYKARELQIPVVMDTNDRGMLDVERFDLEPDRKILHGLAGDLDPEKLQSLTNEEKIPYILQMVGADDISTRLKASMIEVEQTINTWPQLASSVTLGGAITTDVCRRILLDQYHDSGRYYVDIDQIVGDKKAEGQKEATDRDNPYQPLSLDEAKRRAIAYNGEFPGKEELSKEQIAALAHAAAIAPSAGNNQPWKWYVHDSVFYLFHDKSRSYAWGDFNEIGAYEGLGTAIENVNLKAEELNLKAEINLLPNSDDKQFIATIYFKENQSPSELLQTLSKGMEQRHTNRRNGPRVPLEDSFYEGMKDVVTSIPGVSFSIVKDEEKLSILGEVISSCDRLRLLDERGHKEFFHEVRWSSEEAAKPGDGIDISLADVNASEVAGFRMARDWNPISLLSDWDKGRAFQKMSRKSVASASAMGLVLMQSFDYFNFINAGRAVQRGWIYANMHDVSIHPMLSPIFFFNMLKHGEKGIMSDSMREELIHIREKYERVFDLGDENAELFLLRLSKAPEAKGKSHRLPFDQVFYID